MHTSTHHDPPPPRRKKIWEIPDCYRCSVIGSCLNRGELRQLARQKVFALDRNLDDYQLHTQFIGIGGQQDMAGKALQRYLDKKYRGNSGKYLRATTETEIESLWRQDLAAGRVDSAWWGIVTHPAVSLAFTGRLHGELHMLAHDCIAGYHRRRILVRDLQAKNAALREAMGSERQAALREKRRFGEELSLLRREIDGQFGISEENQALRREIADRDERLVALSAAGSGEEQVSLKKQVASLTADLAGLKQEHAATLKHVAVMAEQHQTLNRQQREQAAEIASLEQVLQEKLEKSHPCENCTDQHTANCPGQNLCGRTVLYVGGLHKMVPRYRQLVENLGGRFMHHDGGKEASRNLLPKLLATADAVLCPIDCVSHDACTCVKKICKRARKPFVMMRSASLSSLARGLTDIVQ